MRKIGSEERLILINPRVVVSFVIKSSNPVHTGSSRLQIVIFEVLIKNLALNVAALVNRLRNFPFNTGTIDFSISPRVPSSLNRFFFRSPGDGGFTVERNFNCAKSVARFRAISHEKPTGLSLSSLVPGVNFAANMFTLLSLSLSFPSVTDAT